MNVNYLIGISGTLYFYAPLLASTSSTPCFYCYTNDLACTIPYSTDSPAPVLREDDNPRILCPANLVPVDVYGNGSLCCAEAYIHANGVEASVSSITLPAPNSTWGQGGSLCFYLYLDSTTTSAAKTILTYGSLAVTFAYSSPSATIAVLSGSVQKDSLTFTLKGATWDSVCVTFSTTVATTTQTFSIIEAMLQQGNSASVGSIDDLTASSSIAFLPNDPTYSLYFRNLLLLNKAISASEMRFYYWNFP